jgi:hypothetical protein
MPFVMHRDQTLTVGKAVGLQRGPHEDKTRSFGFSMQEARQGRVNIHNFISRAPSVWAPTDNQDIFELISIKSSV